MPTNIWQQLGAFVSTVENLSDDQLKNFENIGGKWIVPVIYGDTATGEKNRDALPTLKTRCEKYNIRVGGWFNGWGATTGPDAAVISSLANQYQLDLVILDLEAAYQYPSGNPNLMPELVKKVRDCLPHSNIGVSTNGMNNAMIWNGRTLTPPKSFYDLGIRVLPQWYSWMWQNNSNDRPDVNMKWLKENGNTDFNFVDLNAFATKKRGLPLSYVHGTIETTGLEDASMDEEITYVMAACNYGYTKGLSVYLLENMPAEDFTLLGKYRNVLYL